VGTVQRILLAAAHRFRGTGFYGTSLSDIAATAGVSHGSVYTYWADRDALFSTLAHDAMAAVELRIDALDDALRSPNGLSGWLDGWVSMLDAHGAVLYVWTHEVELPELDELTARMNSAIDAAAVALIASSSRAPMEDPEAMQVVVRAILTDVPYVLSTQLGILERDATFAYVIGLLSEGVGAPAAGRPDC
jgi:AcrR family transcriptional regulator